MAEYQSLEKDMNRSISNISKAILLSLLSSAVLAAPPKYLVTHNNTNVESNAFIDGTIPSQKPTPANKTAQVHWSIVQMACIGHSTNNQCSAYIYMRSNTPAPVLIGMVTLDLLTGQISPSQISGNGYTMTVNGHGETTLSVAN